MRILDYQTPEDPGGWTWRCLRWLMASVVSAVIAIALHAFGTTVYSDFAAILALILAIAAIAFAGVADAVRDPFRTSVLPIAFAFTFGVFSFLFLLMFPSFR